GRLGSFDRIEKELPAGESWSGFDRALSGSAYFGPRAEAPASAAEAGEAPESNGHAANGQLIVDAAVNGDKRAA
ncbi:MAG TPA: hypothetical protein VFL89_01740, partial [Solirubrobacterales bacterium]|nr:hypothetical protein [Solirubrobacterales bacterium]